MKPLAPESDLLPRGQKTRDRLLGAGSRVFSERGYHSTRVEDIVVEAKTSHGTFYLYFSSKQELFEVLAGEVVEELSTVADSCPDLSQDILVQEWLVRFEVVYEKRHAFLRTWIEAEIVSGEIGRLAEGIVTRFTQALTRRLEETPIGLAPRPAAVILISMVERLEYYVHGRAIDAKPLETIATLAGVISALVGTTTTSNGLNTGSERRAKARA